MNEGYSDYFAASYTNDYRIGEWVTKCSDTGDLRIVDNDKTYFHNDNYGAVHYAWCDTINGWLNYDGGQHANSMIWSGSLWDLRELLGNTVTDFMVYQGLEYVNGNATFEGGREGILQADINFYQGQNQYTIKDVFGDRGIGDPDPPAAPQNLTLTNEGGKPRLRWYANSEPDLMEYQIYKELNINCFPCQVDTFIYVTIDTTYLDQSFTIGGKPPFDFAEYWVKAVDNFQNESPPSNSRSTKGQSWIQWKQVVNRNIPDTYWLHYNYPNPFNPVTQIKYDLPEPSVVTLSIYNLLGEKVKTLVGGKIQFGFINMEWDGTDNSDRHVPSGIYIYEISTFSLETSKRFTESRKMILIR